MGLDRLPRAGEELRTQRFTATVGGGALITATTASRLGMRVRVMSALGPDAVDALRAERIGFVNVIAPGERPALSVAISTTHDRSFVTFNGANDRLEQRLLGRARELYMWGGRSRSRPFCVHFALAPRQCPRWTRLVTRLRAAGIVTSWDFGWHDDLAARRGFRALAAAVDYLFLNEQEALMYAQTRTLKDAVGWWRSRREHTIIKLGAAGSRWIAPDRDLQVPVRRVIAVDTTGAGDAFNGGFLAALSHGLSPVECLRAGNRVGAATTQRPGGLP